MRNPTQKTTSAFTLVELSIVLVILGLLVGGVLTGQSLIRASELRSIHVEATKYRTALMAFRDKYFAVPGDMVNATAVWGVLAGTGSDATCQNTDATGLPTCNGNGDGYNTNSVVPTDEQKRFWQHLSNAGLIEGRYTGNASAARGPTNSPTAKTTNATWVPNVMDVYTGSTLRYAMPGGARFTIMAWAGFTSTPNSQPLRPEEAWNLDKKQDDGNPGTGHVTAIKGDGINSFCTSVAGTFVPANDATSTYVLNNTNKDCDLAFLYQ